MSLRELAVAYWQSLPPQTRDQAYYLKQSARSWKFWAALVCVVLTWLNAHGWVPATGRLHNAVADVLYGLSLLGITANAAWQARRRFWNDDERAQAGLPPRHPPYVNPQANEGPR